MVKKGEIPHIKAGKLGSFPAGDAGQWLVEQEQQSVGG